MYITTFRLKHLSVPTVSKNLSAITEGFWPSIQLMRLHNRTLSWLDIDGTGLINKILHHDLVKEYLHNLSLSHIQLKSQINEELLEQHIWKHHHLQSDSIFQKGSLENKKLLCYGIHQLNLQSIFHQK
ncbi:Hypothetical_protein [Hexamita inflata]|uniref:Hypothetical_protein n=1 Tax=Hexamita inflata TaxID=28002 RepID=A0AA86RFZ3_9EUKA|nr:Hypothetical protein HINF_LOCUS61076 [Hexamita inflata]